MTELTQEICDLLVQFESKQWLSQISQETLQQTGNRMRIDIGEIDIFASVYTPFDVIDDGMIARSTEQTFRVNDARYR